MKRDGQLFISKTLKLYINFKPFFFFGKKLGLIIIANYTLSDKESVKPYSSAHLEIPG